MAMLLFGGSAFAGQVKEVKHTMMVTVDLSSKDPNIISVENDRIKQYSALKGVLTASIDSELGIINIKPVATHDNRPFSMIIFTEKGFRYTLIANPKKIPAQDVVLENKELVLNKGNVRGLDTTSIAALVKNMTIDAQMIGFNKITALSQDLTNYFPNKAELQLDRLYKGDAISGEVIIFKNITNHELILKEEGFAATNVIAVALQDSKLQPGDVTKVYRVVKNA